MNTGTKAQQASEVLFKLVTDIETKLRWGQIQRENIKAIIKSGKVPRGYRVDWLDATARGLIRFLRERAEEFNFMFPHDRCSTDDFVDALSSAILRLRGRKR